MIFFNTAGSNSRVAKLNELEVQHICLCKKNGINSRSLAALFGVSESTINRATKSYSWRTAKNGLKMKVGRYAANSSR